MELDPSGQASYESFQDKNSIANYGTVAGIDENGVVQGWAIVSEELFNYIRVVNLEDNRSFYVKPNLEIDYAQKVQVGKAKVFTVDVSEFGKSGDRIIIYYGNQNDSLGGKNPFRVPSLVTPIMTEEHTERLDAKMEREQIQDMINASDARADAKFERLMGEFKLVGADIRTEMANLRTELADVRGEVRAVNANTSGLKTNIIASAIAVFFGLAALLVAMMTYGDAIFGRGMNVRDTVSSITKEQQQNIENILQKALRDARDNNTSKP